MNTFILKSKFYTMKNIICIIAVCAVLFYSCGSNNNTAANKTTGNTDTYTAPDDAAIKKAVDDAYAAISFKNSDTSKFNTIKDYFIPQAQLINYISDTAQILSISNFVKAFRNYVKTTNIQAFQEQEMYGRTDQFGNIAQRISSYKTYINVLDIVKERGVNSFQLIKTPQGWKVSGIIWDVEKTNLKIPDNYLEKK